MFDVARSSEYFAKIRVNKTHLKQIRESQSAMYRKGFYLKDPDALKKALEVIGASSTVLGLAFVMSTPASIAVGIAGIMASLGSGALSNVEELIQEGSLQLDNMVDFMTDHPEYDMVEFNIPWLSYVSTSNQKIRFCEATSESGWAVTAAHTKKGWQLFE